MNIILLLQFEQTPSTRIYRTFSSEKEVIKFFMEIWLNNSVDSSDIKKHGIKAENVINFLFNLYDFMYLMKVKNPNPSSISGSSYKAFGKDHFANRLLENTISYSKKLNK